MPITEAERLKRKGYIGCSDLPAMLGLDPYRNAYDLWLDKTSKVEDAPTSDAAEAGTLFEPGVIDWAEQRLGPLNRNVELIIEQFHLMSHLDAQVIESEEPVEAKTSGLFGPLSKEEWGEANTDELPDRVIIQCHGQMICTNKEICHVPAFLGGRGFVMYHVERDQMIADTVMDGALNFWDHVEADDAPANIVPSVEFIKRLKRVPDKIIDLDAELVKALEDAKGKVKWAEQIKDDAYAAVITALGDAEAGRFEMDGEQKMLTFFEQVQKRIDSKRLKEEKPDIAAEYVKESRFRVARIKKLKKEIA
jgi:putative phage-type endonuclease